MSDSPRTESSELPLSVARHVDAACDRFEAAWAAGQPPRAEEYLGDGPGPSRRALLRELLRLEVEYRRKGGEEPTREEFRRRFPEYEDLVDAAFHETQTDSQATGPPVTESESEASLALVADQDTPPVIPGYELFRPKLGEGGMGEVWKARHLKLNRLVALKLILGRHQAGPKELIRFLAEAEAVAAVKHPHVVQVYEYGEHAGHPFLAMEYLPGGSLADRLKEGPLAFRAAVEVVRTLAEAVQAAHDQGIVHRDLKPANVLYDDEGTAKVTDFGLAKRSGGGDLTATQAVMGTPAYMAPEQARGGTKFVGPGADVYSLGVILYECLTGTRPFAAADPLALLRKVEEEDPERPRTRSPAVPRDAELICLKCLAKVPGDRYPTAAELATDLGRFMAGEPVSVRPAGVVERGYKWAWRKPTLAAAYGLTLAVLVLLAFGASLATLWRSAERARGLAEDSRIEADNARATAERERERFERFEYGRTMQVAHEECRQNNVQAARALLEGTRSDLRGWEWWYVHRLCHSHLLTIQGHTNGVLSASFSSDGTRVLTGSWDGTARVWDAKTGAELLVFKGHRGAVAAASYSPDGTRVLTGSWDGTTRVWDAKTGAELLAFGELVRLADVKPGAEVRSFQGYRLAVNSASYSPDGSRVVTGGSEEGTARVWDAKTGAEVFALNGHSAAVLAATFSPDGLRVVTASQDGTARVWDAKTGAAVFVRAVPLVKQHSAAVRAATFSPDGLRVVTGSDDRTARVWDAKTGVELLAFRGHRGPVISASFSPDGTRVATAGEDGTGRVWDVKTGAEFLVLRGHASGVGVRSASFSPDGTRVVTAGDDRTARVWDAKTEALALKEHSSEVRAASFSPDGSRVATASKDGTARVWDAKTGADVLALKGHTGEVRSASFSPDGARLLTGGFDRTARVWDAKTGAEILALKGHTNGVFSASFSPDGARALTGSFDQTARVWDAKTGAEILALKGHTQAVWSASFSPDGARVVTTSDDTTARVWDANTGDLLLTLQGHRGSVVSASFSPDGLRVLTGGWDGLARVWDANTGDLLLTLKGHTHIIYSVSFSPDGSRILTASQDWTVRVWDAKFGAELLALKGHIDGIFSASFSPDGWRVVTGGEDGTLRLWDATPTNKEAPVTLFVNSSGELVPLVTPAK